MMKTVVGSFDTFQDASRAADELKTSGFTDTEVNIISNNVRAKGEGKPEATTSDSSNAATGAIAGGAIGGAAGAAAALMGLAIPGSVRSSRRVRSSRHLRAPVRALWPAGLSAA
jgi:hypothetical protein